RHESCKRPSQSNKIAAVTIDINIIGDVRIRNIGTSVAINFDIARQIAMCITIDKNAAALIAVAIVAGDDATLQIQIAVTQQYDSAGIIALIVDNESSVHFNGNACGPAINAASISGCLAVLNLPAIHNQFAIFQHTNGAAGITNG